MSPKLPVVSGKQVINVLGRIGFVLSSQRGSHVKMRHPDGKIVIVPMHNELAIGTLKSILRQAGIDVNDFIQLKS
jgi:predicted RNA binding protein YcfA (HicA-like mRNA interferase family)